MSFLVDNGCDLSVLFQLLWKHILCTKAIQCYFENRGLFQKAIDRLSDSKMKVRQYLEQYSDKFWVEHDEVLREISDGFEAKLASEIKAALGVDYAKVESGLSSTLTLSGSQKKEIVARTKKAVSDLQIRDLSRAIDTLNEIMENKQKNYYVIIDDLDLDLADNNIKYSLIRSLIEAAKSFRKLRNVKVIIALRSDLYEISLLSDDSDSLQPEKYEGIICEIKWRPQELRQVVERRIEYLFKSVYTKQGVKFSDVFPGAIRKQPTFDYLIDRTLFRPRDVIAFINVVLDRAAGSASVTPKIITDSEAEYSKKRYEALCREWAILHPHLRLYLGFLKGRTGRNELSEIATREIIIDICLGIDDAYKNGQHKDSVVRQCEIYAKRENLSKIREVATSLMAVLYKVGAIELKLSKGDIYRACYRNETVILPDQIAIDAAFSVSPMLWRSLGITPNLG
ncbi:P-loop ATPase, Sll1717 family [Mesorhizobium sp. A556]